MGPRLIILSFVIVFIFSCRKKVSDDYAYYQPYKRDTVTVAKKVDPVVDTVTEPLERIDLSVFRPVDVDDKYFIVIASFSVEEYALAMKTEMEKKGLQPEIIEVHNDGWNKLAVSSYNNFAEATGALDKIRQMKGRFADARLVVK